MKRIVTLSFLLILAACHRQVTVTFQNKTGFDLDSVTIAGQFIGSLKNDASADLQKDSLWFDSGHFLDRAHCLINGKKFTTDDSADICGTEVVIRYTGNFRQEIYLDTFDNGPHLYFRSGRRE